MIVVDELSDACLDFVTINRPMSKSFLFLWKCKFDFLLKYFIVSFLADYKLYIKCSNLLQATTSQHVNQLKYSIT